MKGLVGGLCSGGLLLGACQLPPWPLQDDPEPASPAAAKPVAPDVERSAARSGRRGAADGAPARVRVMPPRASEPEQADGAHIRFIAMGDGGTGGSAQYAVADAVKQVCAARGCDFALYLGDNIYEVGPTSVDDIQFLSKFEDPYAELSFPFYVVLGNHDYVPGVGDRSQLEVDYTRLSEKWLMPHQYYAFELGPALFVGLDTNAILYRTARGIEQEAWLEAVLRESEAPWKIVFGHHPYVSNGVHGSAGGYDGLRAEASPTASGEHFRAFFERYGCGEVHVYFAGHDHDRQWLEPVCGVTPIVSGAAAKLRPVAAQPVRPTRFQDGTKHGFMWVELDAWTLRGAFFDQSGVLDYEDVIER